MKTSTKIELGVLIFAVICSLAFQVFIRKNLNTTSYEKIELSGEVITETREISTFSAIRTSGGLHVIFKKGTPKVELTVDRSYLERINTEVQDGELEIEFIGNHNKRNQNIDIVVYNESGLERISAHGASRLIYSHPDSLQEINIDLHGAASVQGEIHTKELNVDGSSASNLLISGTAELADIELSSASRVDIQQLIVKEMKLNTNSASQARVHVLNKIDAQASSASRIEIKGNPQQRMVNSNSAASVSFNE